LVLPCKSISLSIQKYIKDLSRIFMKFPLHQWRHISDFKETGGQEEEVSEVFKKYFCQNQERLAIKITIM
jgi:hypothetical protein